MKKIIFGLVAVLAFNAIAKESFVGVGYDFYRHGSNAKLSGTKKFDGNAKIRAEWLPFEGQNFKAGIGIAHDFGTTSNKVKLGSATPVYAVFKPEWELSNSDWKFYNKYRLGWSFNANKSNHKSGTYALDSSYKSGPMAGAEIGFEYKKVAFGIVYDANFIPGKKAQNSGTVNHQFGVQIGYVFGGEKARPYIPTPKPVEVPRVEVPEPEPIVEPVPVVENKEQEGRSIIRFQFDHPEVDLPVERGVLNETINFLNKAKYVDVDITGHTDSKGSDAYNERLGQKRAENVAKELRQRTDSSKVKINSVVGKGEKEPVASNQTDEGRAQNRRVEIDFRGWFENEEPRY